MFVPRLAQLHWSVLHTKSKQHEWNGEIKELRFLSFGWQDFCTTACAYHPALQITADSSHLGDSVCCGEIQVNKIDTSDSTFSTKPPVWPTVSLVLMNSFIYANICTESTFFPPVISRKGPPGGLLSVGDAWHGALRTWTVSVRTWTRLQPPRKGGCPGWTAKKKWLRR